MKKTILVILSLCFLIGNNVTAQKVGLLKKVTKSMTNELLGKSESGANSTSNQPEPSCACDPAELILELGGKIQLMYSELDINITDDGSILLRDKISGKYYISKGGVTKGPFSESDPQVAAFTNSGQDDENANPLLKKYKSYISLSGDKYLITFNGKNYGPYGSINSFIVTKSKDKFAAMVVENVIVKEDQGKKMDEAIKNARTDQEKMDLAMKYSQEMQQKMMSGGGPTSILPKFITNIEGTSFDPMQGGILTGDLKYDEILVSKIDGIYDLKGKKLITIKPEYAASKGGGFINSANTLYVMVGYGNLTFSDGTVLSDLFGAHLEKADGQVYLAYMYFSPKKNAIMQCKRPF